MEDGPKAEVVEPAAASPRQGQKLEGGRLAVVVVVVVYVVLFIALNTRRVQVSFVFFTIRSQLLSARKNAVLTRWLATVRAAEPKPQLD